MASDQEKFDREERAKRLRWARIRADFRGPRAVAKASNGSIKEETYKAHETGRNGFSISDGRAYADMFGVSMVWLYLGMGQPFDGEKAPPPKVSSEADVRELLNQIDLPSPAIDTFWAFISGYLKGAGQPQPDPQNGRFEPAIPRRATVPSR